MIPRHGGAVLCITEYLATSLVSALGFPGGSVLKIRSDQISRSVVSDSL